MTDEATTRILDKLEGSARFKHFIWRKHEDRNALDGYRPELMATDGAIMRRLVSHPHHLGFQEFDDQDGADRVVGKIENNIGQAVAMLGYSMFADESCVSILHTGSGLEPGWMAYPYDPINEGYPTLPMRAADHPTLRLVGGGSWSNDGHGPIIRAALEQRGETFKQTRNAFNILKHVSSWKLLAQYGQNEDARRIRLVDESAPVIRKQTEAYRMTARFIVDPVIMKAYRNDPEFSIYFQIVLDSEFMCLPEDWLTFTFKVEIT